MYVIHEGRKIEFDARTKDWEFTPRWREIPGFPKYEVNYAGDVRRKDTHKKLRRLYGGARSAYNMEDENGKRREVRPKMWRIFPEIYRLRHE